MNWSLSLKSSITLKLLLVVLLFTALHRRAVACCYIPQGETSTLGETAGAEYSDGSTVQGFFMNVSNNLNTDFDGRSISEQPGYGSSNSCWWSNAANSLDPENPQVSGGNWTVGFLEVNGGTIVQYNDHNTYGYDYVGAVTEDIDYIRTYGPANGITFPCTLSYPQEMMIDCLSYPLQNYSYNFLSIEIYQSSYVVDCRDANNNLCQTIYY